jgi:hypothetical protein
MTLSALVRHRALRAASALSLGAVAACAGLATAPTTPAPTITTPSRAYADDPFLDTLQRRTFDFFWQRTDARTGLTPDRWPTLTFSSIAAVGFALTAYPIGAERGWVTRAQAAERTRNTLRWFWLAPQGTDSVNVSGHRGFFYHFLHLDSGLRYREVELSTIDTSLLLGGVLFAQQYFDRPDSTETAIRAYADSLYLRVDWQWAQPRIAQGPEGPMGSRVSMAWTPKEQFSPISWRGYDEAMLLYVLALGSPTHPIGPEAWTEFTSSYHWAPYYGRPQVNFAPLFGHQYSQLFIDFRGVRDAYMREKGIDYFENSRRATLSQRDYAIENPMGWKDYGGEIWGLTASDGPGDTTLVPPALGGTPRRFYGYSARGAAANEVRDDGTLAPTAAGGSVPFAPEIAVPALKAMRARYGDALFGEYGFHDAFNPSLVGVARMPEGRMLPNVGYVDVDYLGIDQGPILAMVENYRTELVWKYMRRSPYIRRGMERAGFTGGWLGTK